MPTRKATTTSKKTTTKRRGSARGAKRVLARAEGPQCFWVTDGRILSDLRELKEALDEMEAAAFSYHVRDARNDFADWVEFVLGDTELAKALRGVSTQKRTASTVAKRLTIYDLS